MTFVKFKNHVVPSVNNFWDELLGKEFNSFPGGSLLQTSTPSVNIIENEDSFAIEVAAPGLTKTDFIVKTENDQLIIASEKKEESNTETEKKNYKRKEFSYSHFSRAFNLPEIANVESISANYENGILYVTIPKLSELKSDTGRTINVE